MSRVIAVRPLKDGVSQRGSWQVAISGRRESTHTHKSAAKRTARNKAKPGDIIQIHRKDGTIQSKSKYQGSSSSKASSPGHAWDVSKTQKDIDDMTNLF